MVRSAAIVMPLRIRMSPLLRRSVFLVGLFLLACGTRESAVVSIALHPSNPNIVYVATNEAVHKTRDGGATWEQFPAFTARRVTTLAIDPKLPATVYAGTMGDAIYKSPGRRPALGARTMSGSKNMCRSSMKSSSIPTIPNSSTSPRRSAPLSPKTEAGNGRNGWRA